MNFTISSTQFRYDCNINTNLLIKSFNKDYEVIYLNETLKNLININYKPNDFIIIDKNVFNLDKECLNEINPTFFYIFEAVENNKNIDNVLLLFDKLLELNFNKKNKIIVIGGGITQDLSGFLCSIYKRGLNWVYIPTTLLSITDSAIGAKVNINRKSKNMMGVFYAPNKIYISMYFLKSLTDNDIVSGLGEALKLCLIGGEMSYNLFEDSYKKNDLETIIKISTLIKKSIIEIDELEKNERKALNYGHEIGHALESTSNYFIPHGIGVLYGIYIVNKLFHDEKYNEINNFILNLIPLECKKIKLNYEEFVQHLINDKKNDGLNICFIVLDEIGKISFKYVKLEEINQKLQEIFFNLF